MFIKYVSLVIYQQLVTMDKITIKVEKELKGGMRKIKINWSEYIREAIRQKIEQEGRKKAAEKLLQDLKAKKHVVPRGFINKSIKELRETH